MRGEVKAMADSFVEALLGVYPPERIRGVYWKGSSRKNWDSPIDYVPELSDIDIHVLYADDPRPDRNYISLETGLRIQERVEQGYRRRVPAPLHVPRIQYIAANVIERQPRYVPTPAQTVEALYGEPYITHTLDEASSRASAHALLLEYGPVLMSLGEHAAEKSGRYLWELVRQLTWRVAPAGPRVLEVLGERYKDAWTCNRTAVVQRLESRGKTALAAGYTRFYLTGWSYYRSGFRDAEAARSMVRSAAAVLEEALRVAREV